MKPPDKIIVALDVPDFGKALELAVLLRPHVWGFKFNVVFLTFVLSQLLTCKDEREALGKLRTLNQLFKTISKIFWDGKFNDIPRTVYGASRALRDLQVKMFDVHASAGSDAMKAALAQKGKSLVLANTVLSSLDGDTVQSIFGASAEEKVLQFSHEAMDIGCDGIVASARELAILRTHERFCGWTKVAVGIRDAGDPIDDQTRSTTAAEAIRAGATHLVIGRPITGADDPVKAAQKFAAQIGEAV
ncbi:MAG: Orotidine 5'-phosphate decarboxylase [Parcubacteria group bacterium GW2011_GWB1_57_6]|nr:MAG: Orotidine 5'-phosphate decarboxylase [Parcubacteria group bacterium GW2011_GWA1_56_13]KKW46617.1 MAG: Orotidine 5'-phosphate decarboxylase [Parcubacteria group bacterium GW2011_GWB1_57_6]